MRFEDHGTRLLFGDPFLLKERICKIKSSIYVSVSIGALDRNLWTCPLRVQTVSVRKEKMVDVVLVVTSVIFGILILIASVYFVVHFQHPDDTNVAWFPKIVTVCLRVAPFQSRGRAFIYVQKYLTHSD